MTSFLKLNKVTGYRYDPYHENEEQDLPTEPEGTSPVIVNALTIKSLYPRKNNRIGTRFNFVGGQGFAVKETIAEIEALLLDCDLKVVGEHVSAQIIPMNAPSEGDNLN